MRTFSSIHAFNASRFGLQRATCITSGAEGGGGGRKSIKETALEILRELPSGDVIRAKDWVGKIVERGGFGAGAVWRVVSQIKGDPEGHGVERVVTPGQRGYRIWNKMAEVEETDEEITRPETAEIVEVAQAVLDQLTESGAEGEFIKLGYWIEEVMRRIDVSDEALPRKRVHSAIHSEFIAKGKVERGYWGMYRIKLTARDEAGVGESESKGADQSNGDSEEGEWREQDYYKPFAAYLRYTLLECDGAKDVSGIKFGTDSENPDVIGLAVSDDGDSVRYIELVSAEVKKTTDDVKKLMRGFEQACAYTPFSHKVYYLVIPRTNTWWSNKHESRLTNLCHGLGIGLVVADPDKKPDTLPFTLLTRARRRDPVMSELNRYLGKLRENGGGARAGRLAEFGLREDEEEDNGE